MSDLSKNEREALELRKAGASYDQIAQRLSVSRGEARALVVDALEKIEGESSREVLRLESERIDALVLGLWDKARRGDVAAADRVVKLMKERGRLAKQVQSVPMQSTTAHDQPPEIGRAHV